MKWILRILMAGAGLHLQAGPYTADLSIASTDSRIVGWATGASEFTLGPEHKDFRSGTPVSYGTADSALGPAITPTPGFLFPVDPTAPKPVVSLGDGGSITLTFDHPIANGTGADFAVFENGSSTFLELAFIEVSNGGGTFHRFPNDSLTAAPVSGYGTVDSTDISGLAGKYPLGQGTLFDLDDLGVSLSQVTHVRIIDVIGDGSSTDSSSDPVYDPFLTAGEYDADTSYWSNGFDLDAVGVLNAIPEPGMVGLLLFGLGWIARLHRR